MKVVFGRFGGVERRFKCFKCECIFRWSCVFFRSVIFRFVERAMCRWWMGEKFFPPLQFQGICFLICIG